MTGPNYIYMIFLPAILIPACASSSPAFLMMYSAYRIFIGRTDGEAETPILRPPDAKNRLIGKDPGAGERLKVGGEGDDRG